MTKIKICGITNLDDARAAIDFGADALGFVFFKESPRAISPKKAAAIIAKLPVFITTVGVFVDEPRAEIQKTVEETGIDVIQLHGEESPEACRLSRRVIKGIRVKSLESLEPLARYRNIVSAFLLDTFEPHMSGGTGRVFNWDIAVEAKNLGRIILAGGLTPENISEAIRQVKPYAVDVSSGVELVKGEKDHQKMRLFIERAKGAG
ncbi:MAG: phosphoribosylanthranilate isomerase [Nitrospira bacterium HGW-Nitrospira-1]|nr:MAG: phosphoribosylanthranilate isomerase [Nitrospira bacterium HGW-Nitrospira-1]